MSMEKIDYMLGMTQNMMNISEKNMHSMSEMYQMTSVMMGNLNHMKIKSVSSSSIDMMESMMRNMESMMTSMDMGMESHKMMMKSMMGYMIMMQMSMIISSK